MKKIYFHNYSYNPPPPPTTTTIFMPINIESLNQPKDVILIIDKHFFKYFRNI